MWKVLIWSFNGVATAMFDKWLSLFAWFLYLFKLDSSTIEAFQKLREEACVLEYILIISRNFALKEKIPKAIKTLCENFSLKNQTLETFANFWRLKKKPKCFFCNSELIYSRRFIQKSNNQWTLHSLKTWHRLSALEHTIWTNKNWDRKMKYLVLINQIVMLCYVADNT